MIVSISQPAYLPWLGYFDRIAASELHVELDHVQFEKRSFTSRNKILSANGPLWLSVPVKTKGLYQQVTIENLEIDNSTDWRSNHWKNIKQAYSKAPYFKALANEVEDIFSRRWQSLNELCSFSNEIFRRQLGIDVDGGINAQQIGRQQNFTYQKERAAGYGSPFLLVFENAQPAFCLDMASITQLSQACWLDSRSSQPPPPRTQGFGVPHPTGFRLNHAALPL
ncbi:MAG: WbqC family protein [Candidatus Obscuribacter sp.]|nr:WbqC family protein [Candidatus Obscuribacter sp.]